MNKQKGFTLIELLVVIAIIGSISSIIMASLNTARDKARDAKLFSEMGNSYVNSSFKITIMSRITTGAPRVVVLTTVSRFVMDCIVK